MTMVTNPHIQKRRYVSEIQDYLLIAFAMLIGSVGWVVFLLPNEITMGGLPGISSIIYWGFGVPVQVSYFVLNAILLGIALKVMGWKFCVKTIYAVVLFTFFTSVVQSWAANLHLLHDQPFMAAIVGGAFMGLTSGIGLYCNGSTGGSDLVAAMVNKYHDISLGKIILICDLVIITASYLVLHDWEKVIYGFVVLFVGSFCVDHFVNSMRSSVQFFIISQQHEEIGRLINQNAQRGCTVINSQGFYSGKEVKMLFVLARRNESQRIFQIIEENDPHAFVSQCPVIGVYGLGFDQFK